MTKKKYYVVWKGVCPGIYERWEDCRRQVLHFQDARYKSFESLEAAQQAYKTLPAAVRKPRPEKTVRQAAFLRDSLAVDAACSGNPGDMEYRGVHVASGREWFRVGPLRQGTNNVGEFLALVHGLALMKRNSIRLPLYSDSRNAMLWVEMKKCRTKLERTEANVQVFDLIERAEKWLQENSYTTQILKWETKDWGEIPADFGRK
jgi:ribonuclease HI